MSMLAEKRRKTRYVINPTKKPLWTTDSSGIKFGKELMEKMGWSEGKGLGASEQGIQEPLRVSYKNDNKGMGFKGNEENWIKHQDEFNCLLRQLAGDTDNTVEVKKPEKNKVTSLEEKSKLSKARVHYQKFTRGKDLSRYSESDLSCILGSGKMKKKNDKPEVEKEASPESNTCETSFGVTTINSGSITDYFKKKWTLNNLKYEKSNSVQSDGVGDLENNCGDQLGDQKSELDIEKEPIKKKKKKKCKGVEDLQKEELEVAVESATEESLLTEKKKRKNRENIETEFEEVKKKSKKRKKEKSEEAEYKAGKKKLKEGEAEEYKDDELKGNILESKDSASKKKKKKTKSPSSETESLTSNNREEKKNRNKEVNLKGEVKKIMTHPQNAALLQMKVFRDCSGENITAKALKLICGVNIDKFKGSNLGTILGYGYKKEMERNTGVDNKSIPKSSSRSQ